VTFSYFISTHGARTGRPHCAQNRRSGTHSTRRLWDVAQDVNLSEYDCGTVTAVTWPASWKQARSSILCATALWAAYHEKIKYYDGPNVGVDINQEITAELAFAIRRGALER